MLKKFLITALFICSLNFLLVACSSEGSSESATEQKFYDATVKYTDLVTLHYDDDSTSQLSIPYSYKVLNYVQGNASIVYYDSLGRKIAVAQSSGLYYYDTTADFEYYKNGIFNFYSGDYTIENDTSYEGY